MEILIDIFKIDLKFATEVTIRLILSVVIGALIGSERARHGRAAGMRTHILVCMGAALTSMASIFVSQYMGTGGDVMRISAQVISGIGFLGAGMIILKNNNVITGLTTAAGVWTTSIIGIAVGYGFYFGAIISTALFLFTIILFTKFEKKKRNAENIYIEIDDMYKANQIIDLLSSKINVDFSHSIVPPKSQFQGNLGINILFKTSADFDEKEILKIDNVVYIEKE